MTSLFPPLLLVPSTSQMTTWSLPLRFWRPALWLSFTPPSVPGLRFLALRASAASEGLLSVTSPVSLAQARSCFWTRSGLTFITENGHAHSRELHIQPSPGRSNRGHDLRAHKEEVEMMVRGLLQRFSLFSAAFIVHLFLLWTLSRRPRWTLTSLCLSTFCASTIVFRNFTFYLYYFMLLRNIIHCFCLTLLARSLCTVICRSCFSDHTCTCAAIIGLLVLSRAGMNGNTAAEE